MHLACLPVVHRWEGHRAAIKGLSGWRWQWDLLVVGATQSPTLIGHHNSASAIMLTSPSGAMACGHLSGEDTGWWARIGVGVARMVHRVRIVMLVLTVTPKRDMESHIINITEWSPGPKPIPGFRLRTHDQLLKERCHYMMAYLLGHWISRYGSPDTTPKVYKK